MILMQVILQSIFYSNQLCTLLQLGLLYCLLAILPFPAHVDKWVKWMVAFHSLTFKIRISNHVLHWGLFQLTGRLFDKQQLNFHTCQEKITDKNLILLHIMNSFPFNWLRLWITCYLFLVSHSMQRYPCILLSTIMVSIID